MILVKQDFYEYVKKVNSRGLYPISVQVLPDSCFDGMTDENGEPANLVGIEREFYPKFIENWENLKAETKTIKEIEDAIRATGRWDNWHPLRSPRQKAHDFSRGS